MSKIIFNISLFQLTIIQDYAKWVESQVTFDITKPGAPALTPTVQQAAPEKKVAAIIPAVAQVHQPLKVSWNTSGYVPRKIIFNNDWP